jgi:hypothetical protein
VRGDAGADYRVMRSFSWTANRSLTGAERLYRPALLFLVDPVGAHLSALPAKYTRVFAGVLPYLRQTDV